MKSDARGGMVGNKSVPDQISLFPPEGQSCTHFFFSSLKPVGIEDSCDLDTFVYDDDDGLTIRRLRWWVLFEASVMIRGLQWPWTGHK